MFHFRTKLDLDQNLYRIYCILYYHSSILSKYTISDAVIFFFLCICDSSQRTFMHFWSFIKFKVHGCKRMNFVTILPHSEISGTQWKLSSYTLFSFSQIVFERLSDLYKEHKGKLWEFLSVVQRSDRNDKFRKTSQRHVWQSGNQRKEEQNQELPILSREKESFKRFVLKKYVQFNSILHKIIEITKSVFQYKI